MFQAAHLVPRTGKKESFSFVRNQDNFRPRLKVVHGKTSNLSDLSMKKKHNLLVRYFDSIYINSKKYKVVRKATLAWINVVSKWHSVLSCLGNLPKWRIQNQSVFLAIRLLSKKRDACPALKGKKAILHTEGIQLYKWARLMVERNAPTWDLRHLRLGLNCIDARRLCCGRFISGAKLKKCAGQENWHYKVNFIYLFIILSFSNFIYHPLQNLFDHVSGGVNYPKILPRGSYIEALDQSPKNLAHFLRYLDKNDDLYDNYLQVANPNTVQQSVLEETF